VGSQLIVSIIPARGGSKSIPRKNLVKILGRPLIYYSIASSLASGVDRTIVSTEDGEIASVARQFGAEVVNRPPELAEDLTPTEPVIAHAINELGLGDDDTVLLLQPTSPIRPSGLIDSAIELYLDDLEDGYNALFTAHREKYFYWRGGYGEDEWWSGIGFNYLETRQPRQSLMDKKPLRENGNIYITSAYIWTHYNRFGTRPVPLITESWMGIEIDEPYEIVVVEALMQYLINRGDIDA